MLHVRKKYMTTYLKITAKIDVSRDETAEADLTDARCEALCLYFGAFP